MNIRKLAYATITGSVLLVGGLALPAAQASAAPAPAAQAPTTVAGDNWEFVGYYYWESDCHAAGQGMVTRHEISKYRCDDGSWVPGDDYELEVVWNR
jgi:hypothetical protein